MVLVKVVRKWLVLVCMVLLNRLIMLCMVVFWLCMVDWVLVFSMCRFDCEFVRVNMLNIVIRVMRLIVVSWVLRLVGGCEILERGVDVFMFFFLGVVSWVNNGLIRKSLSVNVFFFVMFGK